MSWEKNTPSKTRPSPTPFRQFEIKHAWKHIPFKICISYLVTGTTCSLFQLCNPVFNGTAICQGLNSAEHSWKDWTGREWKDLSAENFGLSTLCHVLRDSSYRRNSCSYILLFCQGFSESTAADLSLCSMWLRYRRRPEECSFILQ